MRSFPQKKKQFPGLDNWMQNGGKGRLRFLAEMHGVQVDTNKEKMETGFRGEDSRMGWKWKLSAPCVR